MSKKETETPQELTINSADELMAILTETIECRFVYKGKMIRVPVTPLSASTAEKVRELRRKALPPFRRERGPNGSYDELDPAYLKARDENEKKARAVIIYAHCPAVAEKKPGILNPDEIYQFVQGLFTESILEILSLTIQGGGLSNELDERVDFTLAGGSDT